MTSREFLEKPKKLLWEIGRKQVRVETLRRYAACVTVPLREISVRSSPDPTRMQMFLAEAVDEEAEIRRLECELQQAREDLLLAISLLPEENLARVLELHYLSGYSWADIADLMGCSVSAAYKYHRKALALLEFPEDDP